MAEIFPHQGKGTESQRAIHLFEAASEKKRMVHVAVEEAVAFYEVWAFEIES